MAYRPSKRMKHGSDEMHTSITPMMNLMVVLIPLLLSSAEFVKLGIIELNLPPAAAGPEGQLAAEIPQEEIKKLDLTVTITDRGFFISSSLAVLAGTNEGEPSIPLLNGIYDYTSLSQKLHEVKQKAKDNFSDSEQIIIMAEPDIDYQNIVKTMDATRSMSFNGSKEILFPNVSFSATIF